MSSLIDEYANKKTFIEAYQERQDKKRTLQRKVKEIKEKVIKCYKKMFCI